ncbi:MAG: 16S rRNA (uracil(1498)-N(3))-methyltransferase [Kofleriaceae bacterium]
MNLLIIEPHEVSSDQRCELRDRRAEHLRRVLGVQPGQTVRAGVLGGNRGSATVLDDDGTTIRLSLELSEPPSEPLPVELVLAIPRPKVLARVVEATAAFGVTAIELTNAWRVDKSYLSSPRLAPEALDAAARLGAEQGGVTQLPRIAVHRRLMELLDSRWPGPPRTKLIAHPGARPLETAMSEDPVVLAIGPEGGWIERELDTFVERGFRPVSLGPTILRVETAVAAALGQLVMLRRLRDR